MTIGIIKYTRKMRRQLAAENKTWPEALRQIPREEWSIGPVLAAVKQKPIEVWRSRRFLVQIFQEREGIERLTIARTDVVDRDQFPDGIDWEDLQRLKSECGRGDKDAIEIYPADKDVVNVANMRHLWVLPVPFPLTWRTKVTPSEGA